MLDGQLAETSHKSVDVYFKQYEIIFCEFRVRCAGQLRANNNLFVRMPTRYMKRPSILFGEYLVQPMIELLGEYKLS